MEWCILFIGAFWEFSWAYRGIGTLLKSGMRVWIDNTGLQNAGRSLHREARSTYDVDGLLQLGTLLIFADSIKLTGFEPDSIFATSDQIRAELEAAGLEKDILVIGGTSRADYSAACLIAAENAASELPGYRRQERRILGLGPLDLQRSEISDKFGMLLAALHADNTRAYEHLRDTALDERSGGAVEYMIAVSSRLRGGIFNLMRAEADWSEEDSWELESYLRTFLNEALGTQECGTYAPAVARAELIDHQLPYVLAQIPERTAIEKLKKTLASLTDELRPAAPIGLYPSVYAALVENAKSEPKRVLQEALRLRLKAAPLRKRLQQLVNRASRSEGSGTVEIGDEITEIARDLRFTLGLERAPQFLDALSFSVVLGLPPSVSGKFEPVKFWEWVKYKVASRRIVVLTEIVKTAAFATSPLENYVKLARECSRGRLNTLPDRLRLGHS